MGVLAPNIVNTLGRPVPLRLVFGEDGVELFEQAIGAFKILVPSDRGRLSVTLHLPLEGTRLVVIAPDGSQHTPGDAAVTATVEVDPKTRGNGCYHAVVLAPNGHFGIYATFSEAASAGFVPWNFWYFPYRRDLTPDSSVFNVDLWDPLTKYEAAFGVEGALQWEYDNHSDIGRPGCGAWEGHCEAGSFASVIFEEPKAVTHNGVTFTPEEVKFLAAEVSPRIVWFDGVDPNTKKDDDELWVISADFNKDGTDERLKPSADPERFGQELLGFMKTLRLNLSRDRQPVVVDLRDAHGKEPKSLWNHAVYRYRIRYAQPDAADLRRVEGRLLLMANRDDFEPDGSSTGLPTGNPVTRELVFESRLADDGGLINDDVLKLRAVWAPEWTHGAATTYMPRHVVAIRGVTEAERSNPRSNPRVQLAHVLQLARMRRD